MKNRLMLLSDLRLHLKSNYTLKTGIETYIEKNKHIKNKFNIDFNNMNNDHDVKKHFIDFMKNPKLSLLSK